MRLKNQAELLQLCYEKNVELGELQKKYNRLKEREEKAKEIIRDLIESMNPIKFEEDRQIAIVKAEAFLKE